MLVLLPPSEGKSRPAAGAPVDLAALIHPELADHRTRVAHTLMRVSAQRNALTALGVGASLAAEVEANTTVLTNPAAPAAQVYSGVLYDAAQMAHWDGMLWQRAADHVRIISALWGVLSPHCQIPAYRLSMSTALGRLGPLARWWKPRLTAVMETSGVVVDCRSAAYVQAWTPTEAPWLQVSVVQQSDSGRSVVSHMAKHTRGLLTHHLLSAADTPRTVEDVADAAAGLVGTHLVGVELHDRPARGARKLVLVTGQPAGPR